MVSSPCGGCAFPVAFAPQAVRENDVFLSHYTWKKRSRIRASFACVEQRPNEHLSQETRVHEGIVCEFLECFFSIERVATGFFNHG